MEKFKSTSHAKHLLLYHVIFSTKYRKCLFSTIEGLSDKVKELSIEICKRYKVIIHFIEVDKDHIHYMIETIPNCNLANLVKTLKSFVTFHIWKFSFIVDGQKIPNSELSKHYWKERTLFADGYFISSIGNVSQKTLAEYIKNQG